MATGAAHAFDGQFFHAGPGPFVAPARNSDFRRFRRFHFADQNAMRAGRQRLGDLPDIGAHRSAIKTPGRQGDKHHRRAVARRRRSAIDQTLHEVAQAIEAEAVILHFVIDGIAPGLGHALAFFIGVRRTGRPIFSVSDDLVVFPQLDRLVDAARLVVGIDAGNHRQGARPVRLEAVTFAGGADIMRAVQHGAASGMGNAGRIATVVQRAATPLRQRAGGSDRPRTDHAEAP